MEAQSDNYYEMADERRFLLWQDFTRLPFKPDEESLRICSEKSSRFIKRLIHHPSVLLWCNIERRCIFPDARLDMKAENNNLVITTDKFARSINLEGNAGGDKSGWFFEDNYFDLLPGEEKVERIPGKHTKGLITAKPWYSSYSTTINWQKV